MKIVVMSVGTRGDMEPFLAIGGILKEKGHRVTCAFPEQFRDLAEDSHLDFASLGTGFIDMLDSTPGRAAMGGDGSCGKKFLATLKLAGKSKDLNKNLLYRQKEIIAEIHPDRILYNGKAIYPRIWEMQNPGRCILVSPVPYLHYVKKHTHIAFHSSFGEVLNRMTFSLADFGLVMTMMISINWLGIKNIDRKQVRTALSAGRTAYAISPSLFPRPEYWPENLKVVGFHQKHTGAEWRPGKELRTFLAKHRKILFITFGSMTNPEPQEKTRILREILERNKIPAVINTASGGLVDQGDADPALIHFVSRIPYDWILPRVYGVIHHGGSGTTHMALKYGCASMIIPHIIDQFVWNDIVHGIGAGPLGMKIGKLNRKSLEPKVLDLILTAAYKKKAEEIARRMKEEDFSEELYRLIIDTQGKSPQEAEHK